MIKKVFVLIAVLSITSSVYAQNVEGVNARIDAMGGAGVPSDIGWTIGKPSALYAFPDQVQASALIIKVEGRGQTYGSIIAIKSIGDHFLIGTTLNGRRAMSGDFYKKAIKFGEFSDNFSSDQTQLGMFFPVYPELNFCIRPNENLSIGIGGYFEHSLFENERARNIVYNYENDNNETVENLTNFDSTVYKKYSGVGLIADARIWFGKFKINPEFKIFMPKLDGRVEINLNDKFDTSHNVTQKISVENLDDKTITTDLKNNLFLRGGSKFSGTIGETFWILGLWYKTERFEMKRTINIKGTTLDYNDTGGVNYNSSNTLWTWKHEKTSYSWWLGCQPSYSDNLIICPEYSGNVMVYDKKTPPGASTDSSLVRITHKIRLGAEMSLKGFWVFKEFLPRMGFNYYLTKDIKKSSNSFNGVDSTSEFLNLPFSSNNSFGLSDDGSGAKITAGFGLKGNRGSFDLSLDVLQWETTGITGPGAAIATFGLNFGKRREE